MSYRLKHRLFGWHYVSIEFGYNNYIRRVQTDGNGEPFVAIYGEHAPLRTTHRKWFPLTFSTRDAALENRRAA
jgi:hypothetical protein